MRRKVDRAAIKDSEGKAWSLSRPCRHADILLLGVTAVGSTQGFLLDDGTFVSREEAYGVAKAAGQLIFRDGVTPTPGVLYSEDLF